MKTSLKTRIRQSQSGQALLELALLLPLFLLLLMAIFDVGRYMYMYILVSNAARAGAAYGTQNQASSVDTTGINAAAQNDYLNNGGVATLTVTSSASSVCDNGSGTDSLTCGAGHWVTNLTVSTQATFNALFGPGMGIPTSITVKNTAIMRVAPI